MPHINDIVITGIGAVTPIGIGRDAMTRSLEAGHSAIRPLVEVDGQKFFGATIDDFDGKQFVTPRKALKVMGREVQLAYSAAHLAWRDAKLEEYLLDSDRAGVIYGSELLPGEPTEIALTVAACRSTGKLDLDRWGEEFEKNIFPLWMLRNLPNMPACHVGIAIDARGPNNTIAQDEVSGVLALSEAINVIERDVADLMIVGGVGGRTNPTRLLFRTPGIFDCGKRGDRHSIPFDHSHAGIIPGEGSGAIVIERRSHAVKRGAKIIGVVRSCSSRFGTPPKQYAGSTLAIRQAIESAVDDSGLTTDQLSQVITQGFGHPQLDHTEAQAIHQSGLCDVPATAFSSYYGSTGAASGILDIVCSLIAAEKRQVYPVIGYTEVADESPLNVSGACRRSDSSGIVKVSFTAHGHAAATVIECMA